MTGVSIATGRAPILIILNPAGIKLLLKFTFEDVFHVKIRFLKHIDINEICQSVGIEIPGDPTVYGEPFIHLPGVG